MISIKVYDDGRISRAAAARYIGVSANTLRAWNCAGRHDAFFKKHTVAGKVYYKFDLVKAFVAQTAPK
jgi:transposase-like protein